MAAKVMVVTKVKQWMKQVISKNFKLRNRNQNFTLDHRHQSRAVSVANECARTKGLK